jgi:dienelactone hydrolase
VSPTRPISVTMRPDLRHAVEQRLHLTHDLPEHELRSEGVPVVGGGVRRQRVSYAVPTWGVPSGRIQAWLLRPAMGAGPFPGLIALHPHQDRFHLGGDEVAGTVGQREHHYGHALAALGFQVLCPDLPGFGQQQAPAGFPADHRYEEHLLSHALAEGRSLLAVTLDQLRCAVAALLDHSHTADLTVSAMGFGLGARAAAWLAFCDQRVGAVWMHAGLCQQRTLLARGRLLPRHVLLPGLLDLGLDQGDIVADVLPRALGISFGRHDRVAPPEGVEPVLAAVRARAAEIPRARCDIVVGDYDHRLPPEVITTIGERLLAWLD